MHTSQVSNLTLAKRGLWDPPPLQLTRQGVQEVVPSLFPQISTHSNPFHPFQSTVHLLKTLPIVPLELRNIINICDSSCFIYSPSSAPVLKVLNADREELSFPIEGCMLQGSNPDILHAWRGGGAHQHWHAEGHRFRPNGGLRAEGVEHRYVIDSAILLPRSPFGKFTYPCR